METTDILNKAKDMYEDADNNIEIDMDDPIIGYSEAGSWVRAFVWVPHGTE
jgi:hypothetical protein